MAITPFVLGSNNWDDDPENFAGYNANAGVSLGFNFPLDGNLNRLCRERVAVEIARMQAEADKARLDFELVRLLKCAEAQQSGFTFHPSSPYYAICADVVSIEVHNAIVMTQNPTPTIYPGDDDWRGLEAEVSSRNDEGEGEELRQ